ncbi:MATE family efflux transporter [Spiroplasma turonicum]|uniref:MATE efflux family protein n=1 Tax=Spiroplasma turonicum TaxID=216946 RepID=A0A0K1P6Y7_9MOLU|nr:MATE family efflux transporter [Spiroplasma turonicum]AKU79979.1 hypothetical protein STURON_00733 [Spiroplasma turonicum]ALX70982.1 hypothetical protein STURO_v1c07310 [Spiroplasma turonicum]
MINKKETNYEPFEKIKVPFYKIENTKDIFSMAIPIFIQLLFTILISQINLIAINNYKDGAYAEGTSKAVLAYNTLQFVPSLIATGTIIVAGNLIGQGRKNEVSRVIVTGILVNLAIMLPIFLLVTILSDYIVGWVEASSNEPIMDASGKFVLEPKELDYVSNYYRFTNINLLMMSVYQVFVAGLQSIKKSRVVTIGTMLANIIDLSLISILLYATNIPPVYSALVLPITGLFQIIFMLFMCLKYIDFKTNKHKQLSWNYAKETLKTGLPITIEMGVWNICNFGTSVAIGQLHLGTGNHWITLHRNANSIGQYSSAFIQAIGTVTAVFVSRKIGEKDKQGAYEIAINCWKAAILITLISNIVMIAISYPLLYILNSKDTAIPWGVSLLAIYAIKILFDTVNMTLLRSLWSVGDLWFPIIVSFITMGLGMVALPFIIVKGFNIVEGPGLLLIYAAVIVDPLLRSIVYVRRWLKGKWQRYIHIIE